MTGTRLLGGRRIGPLALLLVAAHARVAAQELVPRPSGETLRVEAPGWRVIEGEVLRRLKDGRTVRFDFELSARAKPDGATVAQTRGSFHLSYDLWEERFAVASVATPARTVSHLTAAGAEAWCLEQLTLPVRPLARLGREAVFWLRLELRVPGPPRPAPDDEPVLTLRRLIERLSRRREDSELSIAIEGGPFHLPD